MLLMLAMSAYAQNDVTKFLGIPVDGTKSEMIRQLKAKGYAYDQSNDRLTGEFNGAKVEIYVATTNNKVSRIMVCDANCVGERSIQIRFNRLCDQFKNNPNYTPLLNKNNPIPDDEDISYEIRIHKKRYEAAFYQMPNKEILQEELLSALSSKYTEEQLDVMRAEMKSVLSSKYTEQELANSYEEYLGLEIMSIVLSDSENELKLSDTTKNIVSDIVKMTMERMAELTNKSVWFMISDLYDKYYITMFYDNEYNRANGEDL